MFVQRLQVIKLVMERQLEAGPITEIWPGVRTNVAETVKIVAIRLGGVLVQNILARLHQRNRAVAIVGAVNVYLLSRFLEKV